MSCKSHTVCVNCTDLPILIRRHRELPFRFYSVKHFIKEYSLFSLNLKQLVKNKKRSNLKRLLSRFSDVDKCIFVGTLRDESDVTVTLTGGCPFDESFEVKTFKKVCFICSAHHRKII